MPTTKSTTKKKPAVKTTSKRSPSTRTKPRSQQHTAQSKSEPGRSFHLAPSSEKFISTRITLQTVYWSIFAVVILVVGLLILHGQIQILNTLNEISGISE